MGFLNNKYFSYLYWEVLKMLVVCLIYWIMILVYLVIGELGII